MYMMIAYTNSGATETYVARTRRLLKTRLAFRDFQEWRMVDMRDMTWIESSSDDAWKLVGPMPTAFCTATVICD